MCRRLLLLSLWSVGVLHQAVLQLLELGRDMAYRLRLLTILLCFLASSVCVTALNNTNSTGTHDATAVILDNEDSFGVCVYPRSVSFQKALSQLRKTNDCIKGPWLIRSGHIFLPHSVALLLHPCLLSVLSRPSLARSWSSRLCSRLLRIGSGACVPVGMAGTEPLHRKRQLGTLRYPQFCLPRYCPAA